MDELDVGRVCGQAFWGECLGFIGKPELNGLVSVHGCCFFFVGKSV